MMNSAATHVVGAREPAVRAAGLVVSRSGREVLHGMDWVVAPGTICGVLGPSGCGTTTLLRSVVGAQRYSGTLEVLGRPAGDPALRQQIGYVTQAASVYNDLSITENLDYFAAVVGAEAGQVPRAMAAVGLAGMQSDLVGSLSGGERAWVSLAVALLGSPRLLVLDEPTVGLDPVLRQELWRLFAEMAADGVTLVVSSHVMDEAERCDALLLLREGAVLAAGQSPSELCESTATSSVERAFLSLVGAS